MSAAVSIIMATYNREKYILESLQSIQNQTYTNFECLIIDDGGTDNTAEIISDLLLQDDRFTYRLRPAIYQKGLPGCRNFGLDIAKGDYIIFFDDDDIVHPQNLELCLGHLQQNNAFCIYNKIAFYNDFNINFDNDLQYQTRIIDVNNLLSIIKNEIAISSCSVMWTKSCFVSSRFVESLQYAEEWELYPRIITNGFCGIFIDKSLYFARKHTNSNTGEFYNNDPIRRKSKKDAILLVIENLKQKNLLSNSILKYFISMSFDYKEFKLFSKIISLANLSFLQKVQWHIYKLSFPFRLPLYKFKKRYT